MSDKFLSHHGIKGMKWGIRRYQDANGEYTPAGKKRYLTDKTAKIQRDIDSFKGHEKGITDKKGKVLLTKEDVAGQVKGLRDAKAKQEAKLSRKWEINKTTQSLNKTASTSDKIIYNEATRKLAAKYIVDKNMSVAEATKKAKGDAWLNTAAFVGFFGALTLAEIKAMG